MEQKLALVEKMATTLSDVVVMSSLAQGYHWNVIGSDFSEMHEFFGDIYGEVSGSVDPLAENILKLGVEAPYLLSDFLQLSKIQEERIVGGDARQMLESLLRANEAVVYCYGAMFKMADELGEQGIADFAAGREDMHKKWHWQIKAHLGIR